MAHDKRTRRTDWWKNPEKQAHKEIFDTVNRLHQEQSERQNKNLRCLQLYGNSDMTAATPYSYARMPSPQLPENRVKMNIVASMVDTVGAKISKMRPKVTFLTQGGNFMVQENARKLDKFTLGLFYKNDIHRLHQEGFRDGNVIDLGAIKHYIDWQNRTINSERVLGMELYVDQADAIYGKPTTLYQVKIIHKDVAEELWPKSKAAIIQSSGSLGQQGNFSEAMDDYLVVIEAWRLPIGKAKGRHVICCEHGTFEDEPYKHNYFPFTFFRWSKGLVGFYGQSLADRLTGNQIEINKMLRIIQKSFHLGSAFKVFLEYGSKVVKEHINNEIGSIVYYSGQKPEFYVPKTVHEEFFRHLEWLVRSSYEEAGISQMSASSRKPAGLESGKALREYNDIETERFAITSQEYEQSFLQTARIYIDLACEMADEGVDMEVKAESKRFIETIKWSEIAIEHNEYIMQMFPTSMLPHQPAGRLAFVQELINSGMIPADYGLSLLDFPDTQNYLDMKNAWFNDLMSTLDHLLYRGEWMAPEPFQNLEKGIEFMQMAYLRAKKDNAPEERLDLIRRWIAQAQNLVSKAAMAAQADAMAQQAATAPAPEQAPITPALPGPAA